MAWGKVRPALKALDMALSESTNWRLNFLIRRLRKNFTVSEGRKNPAMARMMVKNTPKNRRPMRMNRAVTQMLRINSCLPSMNRNMSDRSRIDLATYFSW